MTGRSILSRIARWLGAINSGASVIRRGWHSSALKRVVLAPDARTALHHCHELQDDFGIVLLDGLMLIVEDYGAILRVGDCASFEVGVANGHCFQN